MVFEKEERVIDVAEDKQQQHPAVSNANIYYLLCQ